MRVSFGPYVLDPDSRQLLRGDTVVHLSPKAFELLTILVAQRPKAMAKNDLLDRLWPGTFVVEKNLANLISEIRDAIGDDPSNPRFIRTVHRFGYAFEGASDPAGSAKPARRGGETAFRLKWIDGRAGLRTREQPVEADDDQRRTESHQQTGCDRTKSLRHL